MSDSKFKQISPNDAKHPAQRPGLNAPIAYPHETSPAPGVAEQATFAHIMAGHTARYCLALAELSAKQVVALDDERKASMVSNLMTVLCAESEVQPVINTGTLYG